MHLPLQGYRGLVCKSTSRLLSEHPRSDVRSVLWYIVRLWRETIGHCELSTTIGLQLRSTYSSSAYEHPKIMARAHPVCFRCHDTEQRLDDDA